MTAIPAKLYDAFEKIRLGKVEEGIRQFDRVDGFEPIKAVALAELSYFRHDWKRGIQFSLDFLASEENWEAVRNYTDNHKRKHLELILVATCQLECWKESRTAIEELKKISPPDTMWKRNYEKYQVTLSLISDPVNTTRRLTESTPKLRTEPILREWETKLDLSDIESKLYHRRRINRNNKKNRQYYYDGLACDAFSRAATDVHIAYYEKYIDRLVEAKSHSEAAKSYIAAENLSKAKEAIRQYMRCWEFKKSFQVVPIELFTDPELWSIMSDRHFTESLLSIPHHRES